MITFSYSLYAFEFFLMILVRTASFFFTAPLFGVQGVPSRIKIGLAFFISLMLYNILPHEVLAYQDVVGFAVIIVKETIVGLVLGFMANICTYIINLAGTFIDQHMGLSMAADFNPMTQMQTSVTGNLYYYLVLLLLLVTGLDHYLIQALADTYTVIPINGAVFHTDRMLEAFIQYMADSFILAFRIALPVFACIMILNAILGVMAKVAPQMNMFSIGMQLKIFAGLAILIMITQLLPYVSDFIYTEIRRMMVSITEAMY